MIIKNLRACRVDKDDTEEKGSRLSFTASTSTPDRYGDVVSQNWDTESYSRNPVVLLNHDQLSLPIGRGEVSKSSEGNLIIDIDFDMDDPKAAEVARKARAGYMNSVSVGFRPLKTVPRSELPADHYAAGTKGNYFEQSELLEVSMVTIPANPDATSRSYDQIETTLRAVVSEQIDRLIESITMEKKHILKVEEFENEFLVAFAKAKYSEDIDDDEEETEDAEAEEGWDDDEEESEELKINPSDLAVLSALADQIKDSQDEGDQQSDLTDEERSFFKHLISIGD